MRYTDGNEAMARDVVTINAKYRDVLVASMGRNDLPARSDEMALLQRVQI
jgi:hypothetical protein